MGIAANIAELPHTLGLSVGQHSVAGCKAQNEDAIGIRIPNGALLTSKGAAAVIADGVSAAEAGREASETCVSNFLSDYFSTPDVWTVKKSAQQVLTALNRWLYGRGQGYGDNQKGYVTTMSTVVFKSHTAHLFHIGDSRIYRLRDGELEQLTKDHATPISDQQTYLTRAVGLDVRLDVDYRAVSLRAGDIFFLSTDGIHDFLNDEQIKNVLLNEAHQPEAACEKLTKMALAAHSDDNLSCQILQVESLPDVKVDDVVTTLTELQLPPLLQQGTELDGFRVVRELNSSHRSLVYQVEDIDSGKHYCMKTPSPNHARDADYIDRFIMDSWIGSRINSPYVIKVIESPRAKTCLYYLTEFVNGTTLTQWMRENPSPAVQEVVFLIEQIGKGVRAFHKRETIHQDLQPDNIMIHADGRVKIIDFGACQLVGVAGPVDCALAPPTTAYSAPEYTTGQQANYRADLFSLAVISYEMFTAQLPFNGELAACKSQKDFLATKYTEAFKVNPLVPHWIDGALKKGLRFAQERRHADIPEFVYELQHPNARYLEYNHRPLMARDPLLAWKVLAGVLAFTQVATLVLLFGN